MVLVAALVTVAPIVSLIIRLGAGEAAPTWLVGCIAVIWFGVVMVEVGQWLARLVAVGKRCVHRCHAQVRVGERHALAGKVLWTFKKYCSGA